ncbi:MAG: hypothetical protein JWO80_5260 [Bryobacterales bacterium]|nr:hypothetical protein [Bryobacterales bacterium]
MKCLLAIIFLSATSAYGADSGTLTGLDVLVRQDFAPLKGKNVGLITNQTGLNRDGKRNIDLMLAAGVHLKVLFSPEHGILGREDQPNVGDTKDAISGLPVRSLHSGKTRRITDEMLNGVDTLVYDIQDVGARFYTYSCTMLYGMQEAASHHLPYYVLDRPNPITGTHVEGPIVDPDLESYVGCAAVPIRHGLTFGELAEFVNGERHVGADLHVVKMEGWHQSDWWDTTELTWVDPSPNMNSLPAATLYPGTCLLESSKNFSVGRGTNVAYEQIGADWMDGKKVAAYLNRRKIPGVRAYATRFQPVKYHYEGQAIDGVRFVITDREALNSVRLGLEIIAAMDELYPGKLAVEVNQRLIGSKAVVAMLKAKADPKIIEKSFQPDLERFLRTREKYLLYPR